MLLSPSRPYCRLLGILVIGGLLGTAAPQDASAQGSPSPKTLQAVDSLRAVGDLRTALSLLDNLSQAHPESVEVLWRHAVLWSDYGKATDSDADALTAHQQALTLADRALRAAPNNAWAHLAKAVASGRAALLAGSNRKSIQLSRAVKEHADRAIELDPTLAPAYHIRGVWHSEVADLGFFTRTIVRAVYGGLPDASFERSAADLQQAIALEARVHNHLELGRTYLKMGKTNAAREQLRTALDIPPADPFALQDKLKARQLLDDLE